MSTMRLLQAPRPLLNLITAILFTSPRLTFAVPNPLPVEEAGFSFDQLFARDAGTVCGYYAQLTCYAGSTCTTVNGQASCSAATAAATTAVGSSGYWQLYTITTVETDLVTTTKVMSSYVGVAAATATPSCTYSLGESPCGNICCASNQYCASTENSQCAPAGSGSSAFYSSYTAGASAPLRPTTSGTAVVVATASPTTTVPFLEPVPTGANITVTGEETSGGGGLSGGAIAGIVIGVLAGLALLALLCFYCCVRGLLGGFLALFGLGGGKKKKRTTEVEEYERYSHHASGGGGGRTWYGAAARPPTRVDRTSTKKKNEGMGLLGVGAGLAALWAVLGLKRRRENRRREEEKYSEYSSDYYYTSASSASSDDRRTRETRYSRR